MIRRPANSTLFPSTTLFRSMVVSVLGSVPAELATTEELDRRLAEQASRVPGAVVTHLLDLLAGGLKARSEEHTSELQSRQYLECRLLLEKKKNIIIHYTLVI